MRRSRCKRNQSQRGGGLGGGWGFAASTQDQIINNPIVANPIGNCRAVDPSMRPGFLLGGVTPRGLPGMFGGRRRKDKKSRKNRKNRKNTRRLRAQAGGRYGFDITGAPAGGTPWGSSYAPIAPVPCEASRSAIPPSGASGELNVRPAVVSGPQRGGALAGAPITWPSHGAASGSPSEMVPTARYTVNAEPPILTSAGTNLSINTPINYPQMNPACLKTGGGRKRRASRKNRKSRSRSRRNRH